MLTRPVGWHSLLCYTAGPPCQPWSALGRRQGLRDARGPLFQAAIAHILREQPLSFILENVPRLATYAAGEFLASVLADLRAGGYAVSSRVLNAIHHGPPQNRPRLFIVGLRLESIATPFVWPQPLDGPARSLK